MSIAQQIKPGEGLNDIKLNDSLYLVVNQLKHEEINLVYSKRDYLRTPITLMIKPLGINLVFNNDKLKLIEISKFHLPPAQQPQPSTSSSEQLIPGDVEPFVESTGFSYHYNNINLSNLTNGITLKMIYNKIFGPTYPGKLINNYYLLNYPGIAFKFDISSLHKNHSDDGNDDSKSREVNLEQLLNSQQEFLCQEIFIFNENSFDDFLLSLRHKNDTHSITSSNTNSTHSIISSNTNSTNSSTSQTDFKLKVNVKFGIIQLEINGTTHLITIGETTQQEILNILGPPNDCFNKFDSRLLIHNKFFKHLKLSSNTSCNSFLKFNNYFNLGIDFLYDLNNNGKLVKIIMYNGDLIELNHFGHWNKCHYEIYLGINSTRNNLFNDDDYKMNSNYYFNEIPSQFFDQTTETASTRAATSAGKSGSTSKLVKPKIKINGETNNPIILNRAESELINLDVIPINETNNWGQSKLYCYDYCIWEVLNNNCISCVTIY